MCASNFTTDDMPYSKVIEQKLNQDIHLDSIRA